MATTHLRPGDVMLYRPNSLFGRLIAVKSWHPFSHVEIAIAPGKAVASRDLRGVNEYDTRWSELSMVRRPVEPFDLTKAMEYFQTVKGQPYDVWGLLRFFGRGKESMDKQFCSEFATRFYRAGGLDPFDGTPADHIPPGWFSSVADGFKTIWTDKHGVV